MAPHEIEDLAIRIAEMAGIMNDRELSLLFAVLLRGYAPSKGDAIVLLKDVESALNLAVFPWPGEQVQ